MFPVHTGINRGGAAEGFLKNDVPCTHRDKPIAAVPNIYVDGCSLYTQG